MKKLLVLSLFLLWPLRPAAADIVGPGEYQSPIPAQPSVYFHVGPLNLNVPWENVNVVYLFDVPSKTNLVGGEAVIATLWKFQGTFGAVTSLSGAGSPFVGGNLWFTNPIPQIAILNEIKPGIFGGFNFKDKVALFGFKAAFPVFN